MYNVNTDKINQILLFLENSLFPFFGETLRLNQEQMLHRTETLALQRAFHLYIEAMTDVGNLLIDGFIMRDPGSYEDIVDIMEDEKVYTHDQAVLFKEIISFRKSLVSEYIQNISEPLHNVLNKHFLLITQYPDIIRNYLQKELW